MELDLQKQANNIKRAENKSFELENGLVETVSNYENIQNPRIIHRAENEIDILKSAIILEGLETVKDNVANQPRGFVQEANIKSNEISPNKTINDNSELESTRASIHQVVEDIKTTETHQAISSIKPFSMEQKDDISIVKPLGIEQEVDISLVKPFGIEQKVEINSLDGFEAKDLVNLNNNFVNMNKKRFVQKKFRAINRKHKNR